MTRNPVGWFEIYVQDQNRARAFYETVLGVQLTPLESPDPAISMLTFPMHQDAPGAAGALATMSGSQQPSGTGTIVYFSCADCAVEAARAGASGGKVMKEKFSIAPHGFIALVVDPDGNIIGLHSMK